MLDVDTFLTALYVIVDDFCQSHRPQQRRPGPEASLSAGEVIALSIFARWSRFASERDFYRYAQSHLRGAFPTLPERSQFNRLVRFHAEAIEEIALHLGKIVEGDRFTSGPDPRHAVGRQGRGHAGFGLMPSVVQQPGEQGFLAHCGRSTGVFHGLLLPVPQLALQRTASGGSVLHLRGQSNPDHQVGRPSRSYVPTRFRRRRKHRRWLALGAEVSIAQATPNAKLCQRLRGGCGNVR